MSGVLPTLNGKVVGPLETANNVLDDGSGNATIAGALTGNVSGATVLPTGATTAQTLAAMFAELATANVMAFGAVGGNPTLDTNGINAAIDYVISLGGGSVYFPGGYIFQYNGINAFGSKNIRFHGDGPTSKIMINAGFSFWGSGSSFDTVSAASTTNQIVFDSLYSGVSVGDYAYKTGGPQNITVTAISGNTVTFSADVNVTAGDNVWFVHPYILDFNLLIENLYLEGNAANQTAFVCRYGNNVVVRNCIFSGLSNASIYLERCPNHVIENCIVKGNASYNAGPIVCTDDMWQSGNAQSPMGGPGFVIRPQFMASMESETQGSQFIGSGNYAIRLNNAPNVRVSGLSINDGSWSVTSGSPANGILIEGISQGNVIEDCFATLVNNFVTIQPGSGSEPSYIKITNNSVDVFSGIAVNVISGASYVDIETAGNSFDNPMFYPTGVAVSAGGSGFTVGQVLEVGTALAGSEAFPAQVTVTTVSSGAITGLNITSTGLYAFSAPPANPVTLYSGGTATTATINVTWSPQPYIGYVNSTHRPIWRDNKMFAYGGYNPAYGVVFAGCNNVQCDRNTAELLLQPVVFTGCTNSTYRDNTIIGTSPAFTGPVPAGSYGLMVNGGGSDPVCEGILISGNAISGVNYPLYGNDSSGNNTGILYLTIMADNTISNVTNNSQFIWGLDLTAAGVLSYVEGWNPTTFQNNVTFNGAEWTTSANTTPTFGKTLNVLGLVNSFNPTATVSDAGATTLTAADLVTNTILARTNATGNVTDTTDTAANIIAAFGNTTIAVSNSILLSNYTSYDWVIAAGSGVTLSGTTTIPSGMAIRAIVYIDTASTVLISLIEMVSIGGVWRTTDDFFINAVTLFGADPTGATDSTTSIINAVAYATSVGGGTILLPTGSYKISSTIVIGTTGVSFLGEGSGSPNDTGTFATAPTIVEWAGASGGTMFEITPSGTQSLHTCNFEGIYLSGNSGLASIGLSVVSCNCSRHNIAGDSFTYSILSYNCATTLTEAADCQHNDIWLRGYQISTTVAGYLFHATGSSSANFSFNAIHFISGAYGYNHAVVVENADNNDFYSIHLYKIAGAPAINNGLLLKANAAAADQACRSNVFWHASVGAGGVYSEGTEVAAYPAIQNNIVYYDEQNGDPVPAIGTGSTLWWGSNMAPQGMQSGLNTGENNFVKFADGRMRYSGQSSAIAAGSSTAITFSTPFPTAVIKAGAIPTSYNPCYIDAALSGITIYNEGAASATYWWEVEGY